MGWGNELSYLSHFSCIIIFSISDCLTQGSEGVRKHVIEFLVFSCYFEHYFQSLRITVTAPGAFTQCSVMYTMY